MTTPRNFRDRMKSSNRVVFYVIIGLAVLLILCAVVTQTVGWPRVCGGGLLLVGGLFFLLAEDKRWPVLILLAGLALFFWDVLQSILIAS